MKTLRCLAVMFVLMWRMCHFKLSHSKGSIYIGPKIVSTVHYAMVKAIF